MDITAIVALIAAISATISPVITTLITTHHDYKIKTIDLFFHAKLDAYHKFVEISSSLPPNLENEDLLKLHNASTYASLLSSETTRSKISAYSCSLIEENSTQTALAYSQAILAMQNDLYDFRKYRKYRKYHK